MSGIMKRPIFVCCVFVITALAACPLFSSSSTDPDLKTRPLLDVPTGKSRQILQYDTRHEKVTVRLDVYNPGYKNAPVIILIHGSAGIEKNGRDERYQKFATDLMEDDFIAINVYYFDSHRNKWIQTIIETISFAQSIADADPERIGLVGYSLGGSIGLSVASRDARVKALAVESGSLPGGFGIEQARHLPATYMSSGDREASFKTLQALKEWLREADQIFESHIDKGLGHSVPMPLFWKNWGRIRDFMGEYLRDNTALSDQSNKNLIEAVRQGDLEKTHHLLDRGADVNARTASGSTALMEAAAFGYIEIVKLLLKRGAEINAMSDSGDTALSLAEANFRKEIASILKE